MNAPFFNNFPLFFIRTEDAIIGLNENFLIVCLRIVTAELLHATPADQHLFFEVLGIVLPSHICRVSLCLRKLKR